MSQLGQSLHFDGPPATSDFTSTPDLSLHRANRRDVHKNRSLDLANLRSALKPDFSASLLTSFVRRSEEVTRAGRRAQPKIAKIGISNRSLVFAACIVAQSGNLPCPSSM
jgi:hypothetical protein